MRKTHKTPKERKLEKRKHKIVGTQKRPRIAVFRSNKHIYVQAVDDVNGKTLACSSTLSKAQRKKSSEIKSTEYAYKIGENLGSELNGMKVKSVIFDRRWYKYHGKVKAVAEGIRNSGITI